MAQTWQTVTDACQKLAISQRTLYRRISNGEIESKIESGRRYVKINLPDSNTLASNELIDLLRSELDNLHKQIEQQNAIIMQLSRNQQLMLESPERKPGWWSRLWRKTGSKMRG